jgi:hypothetical protein
MTGRSNSGIGHRDPKPDNVITVEVTTSIDPRLRMRLLSLLYKLLDSRSTPDDPGG